MQVQADTGETVAAKPPAKRRSRAAKVRLLSLDDLDARTRGAQMAREWRDAIVADLGGLDRLSTLELLQVENVAVDAAVLRDMQTRWLKGEQVVPSEIATMENTFNRTAAALGTARRAKDVTDLKTYLATKAKAEEGEP